MPPLWMYCLVGVVIIGFVALACSTYLRRPASAQLPSMPEDLPALTIHKYYVISMDTAEGRRRLSYLRQVLPFPSIHHVPGVIGRHLDLPALEEQGLIRRKWNCRKALHLAADKWVNMSPSEVGCLLSHHQTWKHMQEHNVETAMVLEDDCSSLSPLFTPFVQKMMSEAPPDWGMLLCGFWIKSYFDPGTPVPGTTLFSVKDFVLLHCYIIRRSAAVLLASTFPLSCPADTWISSFSDRIKIFRHNHVLDHGQDGIFSSLAEQKYLYSEIEHTN